MKELGYEQCDKDHTLYYEHSTKGGVTILSGIHHDINITGNELAKSTIEKNC